MEYIGSAKLLRQRYRKGNKTYEKLVIIFPAEVAKKIDLEEEILRVHYNNGGIMITNTELESRSTGRSTITDENIMNEFLELQEKYNLLEEAFKILLRILEDLPANIRRKISLGLTETAIISRAKKLIEE